MTTLSYLASLLFTSWMPDAYFLNAWCIHLNLLVSSLACLPSDINLSLEKMGVRFLLLLRNLNNYSNKKLFIASSHTHTAKPASFFCELHTPSIHYLSRTKFLLHFEGHCKDKNDNRTAACVFLMHYLFIRIILFFTSNLLLTRALENGICLQSMAK